MMPNRTCRRPRGFAALGLLLVLAGCSSGESLFSRPARGAFGWIGAINSAKDLRDKISDFTKVLMSPLRTGLWSFHESSQ